MLIWWFLIILGIASFMAACYSIASGLRFMRQVSAVLARSRLGYSPRVALIVPCRNADFRSRFNAVSLLSQRYPDYRVTFVVDRDDDPAYVVLKEVLAWQSEPRGKVEIAKPMDSCSGKLAALITGVHGADPDAEVLVFADSDAYFHREWLRELVDPLSTSEVGATTGFRWYFPQWGGFWSMALSTWNASGANLMFDRRYNFAWGGSMAISRRLFEELRVLDLWRNSLSDDITLTEAVKRRGLLVEFLPQCMAITFEDSTLGKLLEFASRQTIITRVYHRGMWRYGATAYLFLSTTLVLGALVCAYALLFDSSFLFAGLMMLSPIPLGIVRSDLRLLTFKRAMPQFSSEFDRHSIRWMIASLIVPFLMAYAIIKSTRTRKVVWKGTEYDLRSPTEIKCSRRL